MLTIHHHTLRHGQLSLHSPAIPPVQLLQYTFCGFLTLTTTGFLILVPGGVEIPSHRQNQHGLILVTRRCHVKLHRPTTTKSRHEHFPFFSQITTGFIF